MYLTCLECFKVVRAKPPWDGTKIVPMICSDCRHRGNRARKELGLQPAQPGALVRTRPKSIGKGKLAEVIAFRR